MTFKRFNPHLRPTDGKFFIDADGIRHKGDQWEHVANRLASYRKRNKLPPGNPEAEIEAQVCARLPWYCIEAIPTPPPPQQQPRAAGRHNAGSMTKKIMRWLAGLLSWRRAGGAKKVSYAEAQRRAEICSRCPMQREISSVCGACKMTRKAAADVLIGSGKRVSIPLNGCSALGEDTSISVHVEQPPVNNPELPPECWRK